MKRIVFLMAIASLFIVLAGLTCNAPEPTPNGGKDPVQAAMVAVGPGTDDSSEGFSCFLGVEGTPRCWKNPDVGTPGISYATKQKADLTSIPKLQSISGSDFNFCGVNSQNKVFCWSAGGNWDYESPSTDAQVTAIGSGFRDFVTSQETICALTGSGSVTCFGPHRSNFKEYPNPNSGFQKISVGRYIACGLNGAGSFVCWDPTLAYKDDLVGKTVGALSLNDQGARCAIVGGQIICGYTGYSTPENVPFTPAVANDVYSQISVGSATNICAIKASSKSAVCFGEPKTAPFPAYTNADLAKKKFKSISIGTDVACGLTLSGNIDCWSEPTVAADQYPEDIPADLRIAP